MRLTKCIPTIPLPRAYSSRTPSSLLRTRADRLRALNHHSQLRNRGLTILGLPESRLNLWFSALQSFLWRQKWPIVLAVGWFTYLWEF